MSLTAWIPVSATGTDAVSKKNRDQERPRRLGQNHLPNACQRQSESLGYGKTYPLIIFIKKTAVESYPHTAQFPNSISHPAEKILAVSFAFHYALSTLLAQE